MVSRYRLCRFQSYRILSLWACLHTLLEWWITVIKDTIDWWLIVEHSGCRMVLGIMQSYPRMSFRIRKSEEAGGLVMGLFQNLQRIRKCISERMRDHGLLLHLDRLLETSHKYYGNQTGSVHGIRLRCYVRLLANLAIWGNQEFDSGWDLSSWQQ